MIHNYTRLDSNGEGEYSGAVFCTKCGSVIYYGFYDGQIRVNSKYESRYSCELEDERKESKELIIEEYKREVKERAEQEKKDKLFRNKLRKALIGKT